MRAKASVNATCVSEPSGRRAALSKKKVSKAPRPCSAKSRAVYRLGVLAVEHQHGQTLATLEVVTKTEKAPKLKLVVPCGATTAPSGSVMSSMKDDLNWIIRFSVPQGWRFSPARRVLPWAGARACRRRPALARAVRRRCAGMRPRRRRHHLRGPKPHDAACAGRIAVVTRRSRIPRDRGARRGETRGFSAAAQPPACCARR